MRFILASCAFFFFSVTVKAISFSGSGGAAHHCMIREEDHTLWCWGQNEKGQLGIGNNEVQYKPIKIDLGKGMEALKVGCGYAHTCALIRYSATSLNSIKCWGLNSLGQLGLGSEKLVIGIQTSETAEKLEPVFTGKTAPRELAVGAFHTCVTFESGELKCWGSNSRGELGLGINKPSLGVKPSEMGESLPLVNLGLGEKVKNIGAGKNYTCAALESGKIKCWGAFEAILSGAKNDLGSSASHMGESLNPLSLGGELKVKALSTGSSHACVLFENGQVKCWGRNSQGVLGLGMPDSIVLGDEATEIGEALPFALIDPHLPITDLACGNFHCCAKLQNRGVKCWGANSGGQLGLGDTNARGLTQKGMGSGLAFVDFGPFKDVSRFFLGGAHSCVELSSEGIKCFGSNVFGQLGLGPLVGSVGKSPGEMGSQLKTTLFE